MTVTGTLELVAFDAADNEALAEFWVDLTSTLADPAGHPFDLTL